MSELEKLLPSPVTREFKGKKFECQPITTEEKAFMEGKPRQRVEFLMSRVTSTIKQSIPDATEEELKKVSMGLALKILDGIMEASDLGDEKDDLIRQFKEENNR